MPTAIDENGRIGQFHLDRDGRNMAVSVKSYLRQRDGNFIRVEDCVVPYGDSRYIEGAIELVVDEVLIIGLEEWDLVDQLWAYIATMVKTLSESDRCSTSFPDQSIQLTFQRQGARILVSCEVGEVTRSASARSPEFIAALRGAGQLFFRKMAELYPAHADAYRQMMKDLGS
ncbi:hypothetical protein [Nonomuraea wenchangensis]|uniref:hypothetical protein n=1 Tax=Nonomuraea wenchangensis TaxID=568860 RepID=UPI001160193D|nr:hypothetical protein [Nonomuraea wenchangensis]